MESQAGTVKRSLRSQIEALKRGGGKMLSNQGPRKNKSHNASTLKKTISDLKEPDGLCLFVSIESKLNSARIT